MIESIAIADIASYGPASEALNALSQFNFIFGSNGTGKTTISRVIADEDAFPTCKVTWKGGTKLQAMVYNLDFVERNFDQSVVLKGVFTLGEQHVDTLSNIAAAKKELDVLTSKIENLTLGLNGGDGEPGKHRELADLNSAFKDKCWAQKQKHDARLRGAFEGYRGSAEKFKAKILAERASNSATLLPLADLEKRAETVFGPAPTLEQLIPVVQTEQLLAHESAAILEKRVLGKEDVDIAAMIKKLGNSDWVREGRVFYVVNANVCPFCQQDTTERFAQSLNEYFDENFEADSKAINDLSTNYKTDADRVQQQVAGITAAASRFLDVAKMKAEKDLLDSLVTINLQRLTGKEREPSQVVELKSVSKVAMEFKTLVDGANTLVTEHNKMVANLAQERSMLRAQVWR